MRVFTLDTETTGPNPETDRLVTLHMGTLEDNGTFTNVHEYLLNPGIEIPEGASNVHGITTVHAQTHGIHPDDHKAVLTEITNLFNHYTVNENLPIVIYNATFDLTLLNRELTRNNLPELNLTNVLIIDPFIIDKHVDTYRKGSRTLVTVAGAYGVTVDPTKAHDASYDCYLAGQVAQKLLNHPTIKNLTPAVLMANQAAWKKTQSESLQAYLRKTKNDDTIIVNPAWPVN